MDVTDKVRGLFLGTAIGDALGMPVEGFSVQRIRTDFGKLRDYVSAKGHKWFDGQPIGAWTDDTHLTLAVARALIEDRQFTLRGQVKHHVKALETNDTGWGPTTKDAIRKLSQGVDPRESGVYQAPDADGKGARGVGNGVAMKTAPLSAYFHAVGLTGKNGLPGWTSADAGMANWAAMTHPTSIAVSSCFAMFYVTLYCLQVEPTNFKREVFVFKAVSGARAGEKYFAETLTDRLAERLEQLIHPMTEDQIIDRFNKGKAYVYDSLPFAYAHLLRDHDTIEAVYNAASAGGDTDTNASMVGALLGALHGTRVFPQHLLDRLHNREEVEAVATAFNNLFFPANLC